jgi:hypothetical protein
MHTAGADRATTLRFENVRGKIGVQARPVTMLPGGEGSKGYVGTHLVWNNCCKKGTLLSLVEEGPLLLRPDSRPATCHAPLPVTPLHVTREGENTRPAGWRSSRLAHRYPASPFSGVVGEPAGPAVCQLFTASPHPPTSLVSPTATWASVVRGGACASVGEPARSKTPPAVSTADFSVLYEP